MVCGILIFFHYTPKEIRCFTHDRVVEEISWAASHSQVTYRLELAILAICKKATQKFATEVLHLPRSTLSDILHRVINREREGHKMRGLRTMGIVLWATVH